MALSDLLIKCRKEKNLSVRELSEKTNISIPVIHSYEKGTSIPSENKLKIYAKVLGVNPEVLLFARNNNDELDENEKLDKYMVMLSDVLRNYNGQIKSRDEIISSDETGSEQLFICFDNNDLNKSLCTIKDIFKDYYKAISEAEKKSNIKDKIKGLSDAEDKLEHDLIYNLK